MSSNNHDSKSGHAGISFHRSHSWLSKDRSNESRDTSSMSPKGERDRHLNAAIGAMSQALRGVA